MNRLNYIDLFSGIGGFALGAYWAGMRFEKHYFSEVDKYAVELYGRRFPEAISLGDITKVDWKALADTGKNRFRFLQNETGNGKKSEERWKTRNIVNNSSCQEYIITGGFPCQDISIAGKGVGIEGARSGLWFAMLESIRILRPRFVIAENVGAITFRGLDTVLGTLAEIGYDAEWQDIRASDMGAPHRRERIWIVAYPREMGYSECRGFTPKSIAQKQRIPREGSETHTSTNIQQAGTGKLFNPDRKHGNNAGHGASQVCRERSEQAEVQGCEEMADTGCQYERGQNKSKRTSSNITGCSIEIPDTTKPGLEGQEPEGKLSRGKPGLLAECSRSRPGEWLPEPCVGVLVDGLPAGLDRFEGRLSNKSYKKASQIKGIGNAIIPQIAELLFRQIKEIIGERYGFYRGCRQSIEDLQGGKDDERERF